MRDAVGSGRRVALLAAAVAALALVAPSSAQAAPINPINVAFGLPPAANTIAGDEVEWFISFPAGVDGLNSVPGTAVIVNAAQPFAPPPTFASGTIFPGNALHDSEGAFYTVGTADDPGNVVAADVIRQNGNQTVIIPTAFTGINASPGEVVTVAIGVGSPHKVKNRPTACNDCVISVDTTMANDTTGISSTFDVNIGPGDLVVQGGDDQEATVGSSFADPLQAKLVDGNGAPVQGETITFQAPNSGASGTFADGNGTSDDAVTDASGIATSSVFTANGTAGAYNVTATTTVVGVSGVQFSLENNPAPPDAVSLALEPTVIQGNGVSTSEATATVTDEFGNPVSGATVSFSSDGDQDISPTQALAGGVYRATITSTTDSGVFTITSSVTEGSAPTDTAALAQTQDSTAPVAKILKHPKKRSTRPRARFTFDSNAGDTAGFECKLDGQPYRDCEPPKAYEVSRGNHTFRVRATDFAGNTGPADKFQFERIRKR